MSTPSQFDADWYLAHNIDVANAGIDAYEHFLNSGLSEGRSAYTFTESYYLNAYADVAALVDAGTYASGWDHYISVGYYEKAALHGRMYAQGADSGDHFSIIQAGVYTDGLMRGYEGADSMTGGDGNDVIYGNQGLDVLSGDWGNDTIYGGQNDGPADSGGVLREGADSIYGGGNDDLIYGNHGGDLLSGGVGNDTIYGGQDDDTIVASAGSGSGEQDLLYGNRGNDFFTAGENLGGSNWSGTVVGGSGADTVSLGSTSSWPGYQYDWVDFNPEEGDRIHAFGLLETFTDVGGRFTFNEGTLSYINGRSYWTVASINLNREDFDEDWLVSDLAEVASGGVERIELSLPSRSAEFDDGWFI